MRDSIPAVRMAVMPFLNGISGICFLAFAVLGILNLIGITAIPVVIIWSLLGASVVLLLVTVILFASVSRSMFKWVNEDNSW